MELVKQLQSHNSTATPLAEILHCELCEVGGIEFCEFVRTGPIGE